MIDLKFLKTIKIICFLIFILILMTDGYGEEETVHLAKELGQNFCSILWAGVEEHDVPQIFYYYTHGQNMLSQMDVPGETMEIMMNISKKLIGMSQIATKLTGENTISGFPTQLFSSHKQVTVVRSIFPYNIVLSCNNPVSENALIQALDLLTLTIFSSYDASSPSFVPHPKKAEQPQPPSSNFVSITQLLNSFLFRFFEDELSREFLLNYQPVLLPRDVVSVQLYALSMIRKFGPNTASCVLYKNRVILSTAGPYVTTFFELLTANQAESIINRKLHYCFGNLFRSQNPETVNEELELPNLAKSSYQSVFVSVFVQGSAALCIVSLQQLQNQGQPYKPNHFNQQLIMLSDKMQSFGSMPSVYAKLQDSFMPIFMPIQGQCDVCAVDAAGLFRAFRGVQTTNMNQQQIDYGAGNIDAGLLSYFITRNSTSAEVVIQQDEVLEGRQDVRGEFNSFLPNSGLSNGGLISGNVKQLQKVYCQWRSDGFVKAAGACPENVTNNKTLQQLQETYCRVAKVEDQ